MYDDDILLMLGYFVERKFFQIASFSTLFVSFSSNLGMNIISLNFTKVEESKNTEFSVHDSFIHVIKTWKRL